MKRKIVAIWKGDGADGNGFLTAQSGAFNKMPYSFKTRFENDNGELGTNPEELIAGALAGCFNMKLSFVLNESNYSPDELNINAKISDINEEKFNELAQEAKDNCPISGALNCQINLNSSLV